MRIGSVDPRWFLVVGTLSAAVVLRIALERWFGS